LHPFFFNKGKVVLDQRHALIRKIKTEFIVLRAIELKQRLPFKLKPLSITKQVLWD